MQLQAPVLAYRGGIEPTVSGSAPWPPGRTVRVQSASGAASVGAVRCNSSASQRGSVPTPWPRHQRSRSRNGLGGRWKPCSQNCRKLKTSTNRPHPPRPLTRGLSFGPHPTHISVLLFRNISVGGPCGGCESARRQRFVEKLPPIHGKFIHS
jgi:hypothetical protein